MLLETSHVQVRVFFDLAHMFLRLLFHFVQAFGGSDADLAVSVVDLVAELGFVRFAFVEEVVATVAHGAVDDPVDKV